MSHSHTPPEEEEIFRVAASLAQEKREIYLSAACDGYPELRAGVERLLAAIDNAVFMERAVDRTETLDRNSVAAQYKPEEAGDLVGSYKLLQRIGEGGFGVVWMADQEKPVRRRVALKIIKLGMDTKEVIARFEQERQALAIMDHPNIARVIDAGATPLGRPYFAMELVRGVKITEYCDQANLSMVDRLKLFMAVCHAVQHAHQKGIIHRDLKPSNILVTLHDGIAVPKVIDFGVAKATQQQRLTDLTLFTQFEQMIGTPLYMAPEQAELSGLDIDTRSDIYSLGVLLYELLTGRTPFDPEQLMKAGFDEMRRVIREQEPQKPSTFISTMALETKATVAKHRGAEGAKLISSIRGDLDWIVMKALEKDRNRRYETANGLAKDIERHLANEPIQARPPTAGYRFQRAVRRNKIAFAATAAVLASLLIGLGVSTWMFLQEKRARERAVAAEKIQEQERRKAEQVAQFLKKMLGGVAPSVALGRDTTMLREILDQTAEQMGKDLNDQPEVEADLRLVIGDVYLALGDLEKSEGIAREALALCKRHLIPQHPQIATALSFLGSTLLHGKSAEAEAALREALAIQRTVFGNESPEVGDTLNRLALALRRQMKLTEAEVVARDALAMNRKLYGNDHIQVAFSLGVLAQAVATQGKGKEGGELYRETLAIMQKVLGNEHPETCIAFFNVAQALWYEGRLAEAETATREVLQVQRKLLGPEHLQIISSLSLLGQVLESQRNLEAAELLHREAFTMALKLQGITYTIEAGYLDLLLNNLSTNGKVAEAEAILRGQMDKGQQMSGKKPVPVVTLRSKLARLLLQGGRLLEAEAAYGEALAARRKVTPATFNIDPAKLAAPFDARPSIPELLNGLSEVLEAQGRPDEAVPLQREAINLARSSKLPGHLEEYLAMRSEHLYRTQRFEEAEPLYRERLDLCRSRLGAEHKETLIAKSNLARLLTEWVWADWAQVKASGERKVAAAVQTLHERAQQAEKLLREILDTGFPDLNPKYWRTQECCSGLGAAMIAVAITDQGGTVETRHARFPEVERLLVESWQALQPNHRVESKLKRESLSRIVRLYEAWEKPDEAAKWQQELAAFDLAEAGELKSSATPQVAK